MNLSSIPNRNRKRSYETGYMKAGKKAEEIVINWLKERPYIFDVEDLRDLKSMQRADADCLLTLDGGQTLLAEIKSDKYLGKSGNVLFEILRINHTPHPDYCLTLGWAARSPAKWLFYYAPSVNQIWYCTFTAFRKRFQEYTQKTRRDMVINITETDEIKTTINILIPEDYCKDIFVIEDLNQQDDIPF